MPFNIINNQFGLFNFIRRYGVAIQELVEEINGFTTKTSGVYNPIFDRPKWKNVKSKGYTEEKFEFHHITPLSLTRTGEQKKKFHLSVCSQIPLSYKDNLQIMLENRGTDISHLTVIKSELYKDKKEKLKFIGKILENNVNPLNLSIRTVSMDHTQIIIKSWLDILISTKLRVLQKISNVSTERLQDRTFIIGDIGTISDIEMLDIIKEVEMIDAI